MAGYDVFEYMKFWVMVEMLYVMLYVEEIVVVFDWFIVLVMGMNDLVKELYVEYVFGC